MRNFYTKSLLTVLLSLCCAVVSAQSFESNGISYSILSLSDRTVEVAHNANYQGFIIIPSTTDYSGISFKVTGIGDEAFSGTNVTEMIISEGVTHIGNSAFKGSTLKEIIIPNSITSIGEYAFEDCTGLKSITIPNSVTSIGDYAFRDCTSLTNISIGNGVTSIGQYSFSGCTGLTSITIPNSVRTIGNYAFADCTKLISVTIPNSVTSIGSYAFNGCPLEKVEINTTTVGYSWFSGRTSIKEIIIGDSVTSIGLEAFSSCYGLTNVTIGNSVTTIGQKAFYRCTNLTSVTIGNSVTTIGDDAFRGCTGLTAVHINDLSTWCKIYFNDTESNPLYYAKNLYLNGEKLTSITIPNSVTSIGSYAFYNCTGLTSIEIPNCVTSIGDYAFSGCTGLTSIKVESGNTKYDSRNNCNAIIETATNTLIKGCKNTIIPNSVTSIESYAFYNCTGLTNVTIPNSVTSIGSYAFYNCTGLTNVTIPNSVTSIGYSAFESCTSLTSVTIPNSVTSIGYSAFESCTGLTNVTIPNSVTSIGSYAFYNCTGLTNVTIPNSVTSIGDNAFYNTAWDNNQPDGVVYAGKMLYVYKGTMPANTSITIEEGTLGIAGSAFSGCTGLTNVTIPNSVTSIGSYAFYNCTGLTSIEIPNSVTSIGDYTFYGCRGLTSIEIPNSVTSIGSNAFNNCPLEKVEINTTAVGYSWFIGKVTIKEIIIGDSVTSIGSSAFWGCSGLTSVTIGNSVTSIGSDAFDGCTGLTAVHINDLSAWCKIDFIYKESNPLYYAKNLYLNGEKLTSITIPNSVTSIGDYTFYGCRGLTSIEIPNSVTSIGNYAFYMCNLTEMYVKANTPPSAYSSTFDYVYKTIPVYVPAGTKAAYQAADYWKDFTNIVEMSITGDVDGDNIVDIADVTTLAEIILNGEETEEVPTEQTFDAWTSTNTAHSSTSQNSYTMEATEGSVLTFDWEVSSENNFDWLIITLNGTQILKKSGNYSGSYTHTFTTAGTHTLVVKYTKDGSSSSGSDKGKIYNIKLSGSANNKSNPAADVDGDGSVDVADVTEVVNIILNPDSGDDDNTTVTPDTPTDSRAVDLGLSVKWASCNVGATAPEEYGGYYAWGETEEKSDYSWDTYKYCNSTGDSMTKYCTSSRYGTVDNKTTLEPADDVATVKWGGNLK